MRYHHVVDGEWVTPRLTNYLMKCCDCGLVHRLNFRIVKKVNATHVLDVPSSHVMFQAFRLKKRSTRAAK